MVRFSEKWRKRFTEPDLEAPKVSGTRSSKGHRPSASAVKRPTSRTPRFEMTPFGGRVDRRAGSKGLTGDFVTAASPGNRLDHELRARTTGLSDRFAEMCSTGARDEEGIRLIVSRVIASNR